jgi:predicted nuclease of predicted toxin-antitoxin system
MLLLADENIQGELVQWLRTAGHDVLYAAESRRQTPDDELLSIARTEGRVILTDDLDFGELVYRQRLASHGVLLLRLNDMPVVDRIDRISTVWSIVESNMPGRFVVVTADKVRVRTLPPGPNAAAP